MVLYEAPRALEEKYLKKITLFDIKNPQSIKPLTFFFLTKKYLSFRVLLPQKGVGRRLKQTVSEPCGPLFYFCLSIFPQNIFTFSNKDSKKTEGSGLSLNRRIKNNLQMRGISKNFRLEFNFVSIFLFYKVKSSNLVLWGVVGEC